MPAVRTQVDGYNTAAHNRSRLTNGSHLLPGVDGRSTWARRLRDLMELHVEDLGGPDNLSEAEKSIIRRASCLTVELERLELHFAKADGADADALDLYSRTAGNLRRLLEAVGLQRRARHLNPPDPLSYARAMDADR
jgi:hypothetical protein